MAERSHASAPHLHGAEWSSRSRRSRSRRRPEEHDAAYRAICEQHPDAMLAIDGRGRIARANQRIESLTGIARDGLIGREWISLFDAASRSEAELRLREAFSGVGASHLASVVRSDLASVDVRVTLMPHAVAGRAEFIHAILHDLTPRLRAERALAMQAERMRELCIVAAVRGGNPNDQIRATLELGCRLLGLDVASLCEVQDDGAGVELAVDIREKTAPEQRVTIPIELGRLPIATTGALAIADLGGIGLQTVGRPGIGELRAYIGAAVDVLGVRYGSINFAGAQPRPDDEPFSEPDRDLVQLISALVGSALERRQSRSHLRTLAYYDALTGLPNRARFNERALSALQETQRDHRCVAVLSIDLDRFRDVNDTLGHAAGDRLLRTVADRLRACAGESATVARVGGDEFVLLVPDAAGPKSVMNLAERLLHAIEVRFEIDGYEHYISASIGIALHPNDGRDVETLVKHADVAMYRAKDRGRNVAQFFKPELNAAVTMRLSQEKSLRRALQRREFRLVYQPQIDLATGRVAAIEALVRWQHPRLGLVPPGSFIPSAELSGVIVPLGDWVLDTACAQLRRLALAGHAGLRLAINFSARQFHRARLADEIADALRRHELPPRSLEVEITESVAMQDVAQADEITQRLKAAGVAISVDDFGTGYASLGYLRRFPLDALKIDQSFVRDLFREPHAETIVTTVIAMAHGLSLDVIAEGVETEEQLAFLRAEGCDGVQGYLCSPPLEPDELARYLDATGVVPPDDPGARRPRRRDPTTTTARR